MNCSSGMRGKRLGSVQKSDNFEADDTRFRERRHVSCPMARPDRAEQCHVDVSLLRHTGRLLREDGRVDDRCLGVVRHVDHRRHPAGGRRPCESADALARVAARVHVAVDAPRQEIGRPDVYAVGAPLVAGLSDAHLDDAPAGDDDLSSGRLADPGHHSAGDGQVYGRHVMAVRWSPSSG